MKTLHLEGGLIPVRLDGELSTERLKSFQETYSELMYEFFADRPKNTAKAYRTDLKKFFEWTIENFAIPVLSISGIAFCQIRRAHVVKYKNFLNTVGGKKGNPATALTIIRKLAAIKSWYNFLLEKDLATVNPAASVRRPKAIVSNETQDFSDREVKELFKIVDEYNSKAHPLHKAIVCTLFTTALRQGELCSLKRSDLKEEEGIFYLEFIAKGEKKQKTALHPSTAFHVKSYLEWMRLEGREHTPTDPLFQPTVNRSNPSHLTKPLSAMGIRYIIQKYAEMINNEKVITPHSARATVIGSLLQVGKPIYEVSRAVGHSSVETTRKYDKRGRRVKDSPFLSVKFYR